MSNFERKYPACGRMICLEKTKSAKEKGLLTKCPLNITNLETFGRHFI